MAKGSYGIARQDQVWVATLNSRLGDFGKVLQSLQYETWREPS